MGNLKWIIFILILFASGIVAFAQNSNQEIPQGMEIIKIEGNNSGQLIVPKGAKVRKIGAQIIVEGTKEYMSRRFYEMEERLVMLEQNQGEAQQEIRELKETIRTIRPNH